MSGHPFRQYRWSEDAQRLIDLGLRDHSPVTIRRATRAIALRPTARVWWHLAVLDRLNDAGYVDGGVLNPAWRMDPRWAGRIQGPAQNVRWSEAATEWLRNSSQDEARLDRRIARSIEAIEPRTDPLTVPALLLACLMPDPNLDPPGLRSSVELRRWAISSLESGQRGSSGPVVRPAVVTQETAALTVAAFEPATAALQSAALDAGLDPDEAEFLRSTLQSIVLWRQRPEANPQIFELLLADLIKVLVARLANRAVLTDSFSSLGAPPDEAEVLAEEVVAAIEAMMDLGQDDAAADGATLERIAGAADRTATGLERLAELSDTSPEGFREAVAKGAGSEAGRFGTSAVLGAAALFVSSNWAQIQLHLLQAYHWLFDLWRLPKT